MTTVYLAITETEHSNFLIKVCDSLDAELKHVVCGPIEVKISDKHMDELVRICHNGKRGKPASHQSFPTFMELKRQLKTILSPEDCELFVQKRKIQEITDDDTEFSEDDTKNSKETNSKKTVKLIKEKNSFKQDIIDRIKEVCHDKNKIPFDSPKDIAILPFYSVYEHNFISQLITIYPSRIVIPSLKFVGSFLLFHKNFEEFQESMKGSFPILRSDDGLEYFALKRKDLEQITNPHYSLESVRNVFSDELVKIVHNSGQMED